MMTTRLPQVLKGAREYLCLAFLVVLVQVLSPELASPQQPQTVFTTPDFPSAVQAIGVESSSTIWLGTEANGVFRSADGGKTWTPAGLTNQSVRAIQTESDGRVLVAVAGWNGGLFETRNAGASWERQGPTKYAQAIASDPAGDVYYLGTRGGSVLRSDPSGWRGIGRGLGMTTVHALLVAPDHVLWVGTEDGIYWSSNRGETWERPRSGLRAGTVRAIVLSPAGTLIAGTHRGIFRSSDRGETWFAADGVPASTNIRSFALDGTARIWAATEAGLFWSEDDGLTWTRSESQTGGYAALALGPNRVVLAGPATAGRLVAIRSADDRSASREPSATIPSQPAAEGHTPTRSGRFAVYLIERLTEAEKQLTDPTRFLVAPLLFVDDGKIYPGDWPYHRGGDFIDTEDRRAVAAMRDTLRNLYFPPRTTLRLLRGGVQVGTAPLESWRKLPDDLAGATGSAALAGRFFCWDASALRRANTPDATLAVAVEGVGHTGPVVDRLVRSSEVTTLRAAAHRYLLGHGVTESVLVDLQVEGVRAIDLDHDGSLELVGSATAGGGGESLIFVVPTNGMSSEPVFAYQIHEDPPFYKSARWVDHLDLDGDGSDEIIIAKSVKSHGSWSVFSRGSNGWSEKDVGDAHPCFSENMQTRIRAAGARRSEGSGPARPPASRAVLYTAWRTSDGEYDIQPIAEFRGAQILDPIGEAIAESRRTSIRPEEVFVEMFYPDTAVLQFMAEGREVATGTTSVKPSFGLDGIPTPEAALNLTSGGFSGTMYTSVPAGAITAESQPVPAEVLPELRRLGQALLSRHGVPQSAQVSLNSTISSPRGLLAVSFDADAGGRRHLVLAIFRNSPAGLQLLHQQHSSFEPHEDGKSTFSEAPLVFLRTPTRDSPALLTRISGYEYTGNRIYAERNGRWVQVFPQPKQ